VEWQYRNLRRIKPLRPALNSIAAGR
jgi:hypothetical protein